MFSKQTTYLFILCACLFTSACHRAPFTHAHSAELLRFDTSRVGTSSRMDQLIQTYKVQIDSEMNVVVGHCGMDLFKARPECNLGNAVTDILIRYALDSITTDIDLCVMNLGGLRTSLSKGSINRGKVFELMPFDNALVIVDLTAEQLVALGNHIIALGGEPVGAPGGVKLTSTGFQFNDASKQHKSKYRVLTSDYLANGGDRFSIFTKASHQEATTILIRDALIEYFVNYTSQSQPLVSEVDGRIQLN